jgi:F-type H+-transporting ATPase subunit delta
VHIARPYAQALFDLAREEGAVDAIEAELGGITQLITESQDFSNFLRSPVIASDTKAEAMDSMLKRMGLGTTTSNFIRLVARNGRLFALPNIIDSYKAMAAEARGEVTAEVTSAAPLKPAQVEDLAQTLKQKIGKTVALTQIVDPSLIGGLIVKVGSRMIDSSLRTKLTAMKIAMKEVR